MKKHIQLLIVLLTFQVSVVAQPLQKEAKELDKAILEAINLWQPPAFAVAVVKDGQVVFQKAYGKLNAEDPTPADEHTLFVCASTTKAFTAAAIAMLVDDGKLNWDDKVIDHLPAFRLKDPYATRELTIRDLLTHRSGLGNTDYLWTTMNIGADSAVTRLVDADMSYSLRSSFIYQNLMYLVAGKVIEAVSGKPWSEFVKERIYTPLGMTETHPSLGEIEGIANKASGHFIFEGTIIPTQQLSADAIAPAGAMWSSISDMAKWLQFLDNDGVCNGDTLISRAVFDELFTPQQIIPSNQFYPSIAITQPNWMTYGLGWFQHDYKGMKVDFHTGSLPGMVAIAGIIRSENVAMYAFGNLDHAELRHSIMYTVFDLYTKGKSEDNWNVELKKLYERNQTEEHEDETMDNAPAIHPADSLIGEYVHPTRGRVKISLQNNILLYSLNDVVTGSLEHWNYDSYKITFDRAWYGQAKISFYMNADGNISYLETWGIKFNKDKTE